MRSERRCDPTIGVSCGHRVPREPRIVDGRKLYWCAGCGAFRMSGGKSTGLQGFDFLLELRELVHGLDEPVEIRVPFPFADWQVALIEKLGGRVIVDPDGCAGCGRRRSACGCPPPPRAGGGA